MPKRFRYCTLNYIKTLDFCKVADIVCPILSCRDCDVENVALNPYEKSNSFDDFGY